MNVVMISGRLTADPEVRYSNNGVATLRFYVAINNGRDKDGNDYPATFVPCLAFNQTAEYIFNYAYKGGRLTILGRWNSGSYDNNEGEAIYFNECVVNKCELIDYIKPEEAQEQPKKTTKNNTRKNKKSESRPNPRNASTRGPRT